MRRCLCCSRWPNLVVWGGFRDEKKRNRDLGKGRKKASWKNSWNWESTTSALRKIYSFREREEILAAYFLRGKERGNGWWLLAFGYWAPPSLDSDVNQIVKEERGSEKEGRGHAQDFPNRFRKSFLPSFFPHPVTPVAALWSEVKVDFEVGVIPNLIYIFSSFPPPPFVMGKSIF